MYFCMIIYSGWGREIKKAHRKKLNSKNTVNRFEIYGVWSRRWDLNPQPTDYKSVALPIELLRRKSRLWCLGAESNHRHRDFQSLALPTELPRQKFGDPEGT